MRIAMITIGSTGDVYPYLLLGKELQRRGHDITVCAFKNFREDVEREGFRFAPIDRDAREFMKQVLSRNKGGLDYLKNATPSLQAFWDLRQNFFAYFLSFFWLGSLWMALNTLWEKVEKISPQIVWWNLFLLFFVSFMPPSSLFYLYNQK